MQDVLLRLGISEETFARRSSIVHFLRIITNAYCIRAACSGARNFSKSPKKPIQCGEPRTLYHCAPCARSFSETRQTPIAQFKTPIALVVQVLAA
jgi:hypothetical protein